MVCMVEKKSGVQHNTQKNNFNCIFSQAMFVCARNTGWTVVTHTKQKINNYLSQVNAQRERAEHRWMAEAAKTGKQNRQRHIWKEIKISTSFTLLQNYSVARVEWNVQNLSHSISILYLRALFDINLLKVVLFVSFVVFFYQFAKRTHRDRQTKFIWVHIAIEWIK